MCLSLSSPVHVDSLWCSCTLFQHAEFDLAVVELRNEVDIAGKTHHGDISHLGFGFVDRITIEDHFFRNGYPNTYHHALPTGQVPTDIGHQIFAKEFVPTPDFYALDLTRDYFMAYNDRVFTQDGESG